MTLWLVLLLACGPGEDVAGDDTDVVDTDIDVVDTDVVDTDLPAETDPPFVLCDADMDGFGLNGVGCLPVDPPDCDDVDAAVFPGAEDVCDGVDNDCSGAADDAFDRDGDGAAGCAGDCDDDDRNRSPAIPEVCDGADNDCDGAVDEGFDGDGDGASVCRGDCDDTNPAVRFGEVERCDGVDNDCDPLTSEDGDVDGDGVTRCQDDCDDTNPTVFPGNPEICDFLDNDCDGRGDSDPACFGCSGSVGPMICGAAVPWATARDACADFGMILAMPKTARYNDQLAALAAPYGSVWIGLTDEAVEGTFAWIDGTPLTFERWWVGEPNDSGGEDCAGNNFGDFGYWNDYTCATSLPFVCQGAP
jgi:hypothetical protein